MLIDELMRVAVEPALGRQGRVVQVAALVVAFAGLHEHDGPLEAFAAGTGEEYGGRPRAARGTASAVHAHAAVVELIELSAPAAGVMKTERLRRLLGTRAFSSLL